MSNESDGAGKAVLAGAAIGSAAIAAALLFTSRRKDRPDRDAKTDPTPPAAPPESD